jgi:hypothetical protein
MQLTDKALKEFEAIWLEDHPGQTITKEDLLALAARVMMAVELTYRPIPLEKIEIFKQIQRGPTDEVRQKRLKRVQKKIKHDRIKLQS